jgi:hypothetical protein
MRSSRFIIVMSLVSATLVIAVAFDSRAAAPATAPAAAADAAKAAYRTTAPLDLIAVGRVAVAESPLADDLRAAGTKALDGARDIFVATVEAEAKSPTDDAERKRKMSVARERGDKQIGAALDKTARRIVGERTEAIITETKLIADGGLMDKMDGLELTDEQRTAISRAVKDAQRKSQAVDANDGVPINEKRIVIWLNARKAIRDALTAAQRTKWDQELQPKPRPKGVGVTVRMRQ